MIYDLLIRGEQYKGLVPGLALGLRYLAETDFSTLDEGRYEIDGDRVFALIQRYDTRPENPTPEAHKDYMDIQYLFQGEELVGVMPTEELGQPVESHEERDIWFYRGEGETLTLGKGRFLALWPGDAHAPCIAVDGKPAPVGKCVIKVKL